MYIEQSGEFVCGYWGLKVNKVLQRLPKSICNFYTIQLVSFQSFKNFISQVKATMMTTTKTKKQKGTHHCHGELDLTTRNQNTKKDFKRLKNIKNKTGMPCFPPISNKSSISIPNEIYRGYYTVAGRYEFYFRVAKQYFTNEGSE